MNGVFVVSVDVILSSSCFAKHDHPIRPLRSSPLQRLHHYYGSVRPSFLNRYARLTVVCRSCFSLGIRKLVPAVPRKSLPPAHAPSTPVTARPVIRLPTDLFQEIVALLVLMTSRHPNSASSKGSRLFVFRTLTCSRSCLELLIQR